MSLAKSQARKADADEANPLTIVELDLVRKMQLLGPLLLRRGDACLILAPLTTPTRAEPLHLTRSVVSRAKTVICDFANCPFLALPPRTTKTIRRATRAHAPACTPACESEPTWASAAAARASTQPDQF